MLMEGFVLKPFPYGDTEKTGYVHQLHAGATWMKHPLEDVSQRCDRTPQIVPEFGNDENRFDKYIKSIFSEKHIIHYVCNIY